MKPYQWIVVAGFWIAGSLAMLYGDQLPMISRIIVLACILVVYTVGIFRIGDDPQGSDRAC